MKSPILLCLAAAFASLLPIGARGGETPTLAHEQRAQVIADASRAITDYARLPNPDGVAVPERLWGAAIVALKPLRVDYYHGHLKIVMADDATEEAGFMVLNPVSAFAPERRNFAEFAPLSPATDAFELYRYRIAKLKPH